MYEVGTLLLAHEYRNNRAHLRVCYNRRVERDDTDVVLKLKTESRGVVNPNIVRWIAFVVITISLVACTVLCILAIWKFTESDAVWRAIATFIVVSIATAIFTFVNEKLG
jgi:Na+-transporting NADH:ubiquinone oxidoreductase subunit NqrB